MKSSCCSYKNTRRISTYLEHILELYQKSYNKRAFLHWYVIGLRDGDFPIAQEEVREWANNYERYGIEDYLAYIEFENKESSESMDCY